jgi:hypothetical protein
MGIRSAPTEWTYEGHRDFWPIPTAAWPAYRRLERNGTGVTRRALSHLRAEVVEPRPEARCAPPATAGNSVRTIQTPNHPNRSVRFRDAAGSGWTGKIGAIRNVRFR